MAFGMCSSRAAFPSPPHQLPRSQGVWTTQPSTLHNSSAHDQLFLHRILRHAASLPRPLTSKLKVSRRCSAVSGVSSGMFLGGRKDEAGEQRTASQLLVAANGYKMYV